MAFGKLAALAIAAAVVAGSGVALFALNGSGGDAPVEPASTTTPPAQRPVDLSPIRDVLLAQSFVFNPLSIQPLAKTVFTVDAAKGYNMVQVDIAGDLQGAYATALPSIKIKDPSGSVVVDYSRQARFGYPSIPANPVTGPYEARPFTIASLWKFAPGEYTVEVSGVSTPITLSILGLRGAAPDFTLADALGKGTIQLSELRGKAVIVDLFATWCGPCKALMKTFAEIYPQYAREQLEIVSVDVDPAESDADIRSLFESNGWAWYAGMDDGTVDANYGSGYIPTMAVVNAQGLLVYRHIGSGITAEELKAIIDHAIAGSPVATASSAVSALVVTNLRLAKPAVQPGDDLEFRADVNDAGLVTESYFTVCRADPPPYTCFAKVPMTLQGTTLVGTTAGNAEVPKLENGWDMELHLFVRDATGKRHEYPENDAYRFTVGASSAAAVPGLEPLLALSLLGAAALVLRRP
ncbi:MAG TPA: TlpA disulfide reductase family protein [Candidatus Thermoplasmatota archaeon]|nr:TlpA disulfide reductase family protein [Candidatus Thermoplasmatota archaeon]